ncbi:MAG: DNA-directed RNA polymerase subunit D [Candidatus Micrarchaeota archaeon]|nr:DNA-directed RNA polymerase subunit D [Candidatus Micrarchaeota archaeon]
MEVSILKEEGKSLDFRLSGSSVGFANLLRRYAMNQVPTFAIDTVTVYENSSSLFDEYIANRVGLVPLKMAGNHKADDEIGFTLEASGPCTVYSGDLKAGADKIKVATDKIPLLKLLQDQNLRLEGKAIMGIGRKHAKWQAGMAGYEITPQGLNFKVESFMQMPPRAMVETAAELVEKKCDEMDEQLEAIRKGAKKAKEE